MMVIHGIHSDHGSKIIPIVLTTCLIVITTQVIQVTQGLLMWVLILVAMPTGVHIISQTLLTITKYVIDTTTLQVQVMTMVL